MAVIGTFTKSNNGTFGGTIATLTIKAKVEIKPLDLQGENPPSHRVIGPNGAEIGAGWTEKAEGSGREYLSVKLDDPSFPAPVWANLVEIDGTHSLIWKRPPPKRS